MMNRLLVTLLVVSQLALALHHQAHARQDHFATDEVFQNGLVQLEQGLIQSMDAVQQQLQQETQHVKGTNSTAGKNWTDLDTKVADQYKALKKVEAHIKVPLSPKPCNSTPQAVQSRDALRKKSDQLNATLQAFKKALKDCDECPVTRDLNRLILQQKNYLMVIDQICDSNCTRAPQPLPPQNATGVVDLSKSQYKNNLAAKNWIFGNITETQYKYQVFEESIKHNLTDCPLEKPYVNPESKNCFDCPEGLKFNLGKKTCQPCPQDFTFDLVSNQCKSPCRADEIYNSQNKKCQPRPIGLTDSICPLDKPIWDSVSKSCVLCPRATPAFNQTIKKCVPCPDNSTWVDAEQKCIPTCPQGQEYDPTTGNCTNPTQCPNGQTWNSQTNRCQLKCKDGYRVNPRTNACQKVQPRQCDDIKPIWNSTSLQCQICPEDTPVWNKTEHKCQPCPKELPVYDYSLFKCVQKICDPGFKWNQVKLKCSPKSGNCSKDKVYSFQNETCVQKCQANHTYYPQNDTCQCFPERPLFNRTTRKCQDPKCNVTGQKWNQNLRKCISEKGNCNVSQRYNFTSGECVSRCEPGVPYIASDDSCQCPPDMPTFNRDTRKCEEGSCAEGLKWNRKLRKCSPVKKNCSDWQVYDFDTEDCIDMCEPNHTYLKENDTCQCTAEYPLFDPSTRTCQKPICPKGHAWNKVLIKCSYINKTCESWEEYDFKTEECIQKCEVNQTYYQKYDNCTCPPERPAYNKTARQCQEPLCPVGYKFSPVTVCCLPLTKKCETWQAYNSTIGLCVNHCEVNQTYFLNNDTCTCPPERPFYNTTSKACTEPPCPNGTAWNVHLRNCTLLDQPCQDWQLYSFEEGKCLNKCPVNHTYYKDEDRCACDPETPEYQHKTHTCVEPICPDGTLWNKYLIKCSQVKKQCRPWQTYDFKREQCEVKCEVNITYDRRNNLCLCPAERPYLNEERKCVQPECPAGYKYNAQLIKCSSELGSCDPWQQYNFNTEQCITKCEYNHTYLPDTDSCTCKPEVPHFDPQTRTCIQPQCPEGHMWNRHLIKCSPIVKECQKWQRYNFTLEKCLNMCEVNHTYYSGDGTCECFADAPHFDPNTRKCTIPECPAHHFWNAELRKCSPKNGTCKIWQAYNPMTQQCDVKCKINQQYHPDTDSCQCTPEHPLFDHKNDMCIQPPCPTGYKYNKLKTKCSPIKPVEPCLKWQFYDFLTEECIARCQVNHTYYEQNDTCECFEDKPHFNKDTRECQVPTCEPDYKWNPHLKKCQSIYGYCMKWQVYNFTDDSCITMCDKYQTYYPNNDTCHCYPADPIFNRTTRKCQQPICWYGKGWDRVNYRCRCDQGYEYNQTAHTCQLKCQQGYFLNHTSGQCEYIIVVPICGANMFVNASNQCECLSGYVYQDTGLSCRINCTDGYRYNSTTQQCDKIVCPDGYYFDYVTQNCEKKQITCPPGFFYNARTNQCVSCPSGYVYNDTLNECVAELSNLCPENYTYNPQTRLCDPHYIPDTNCPPGFHYDKATARCVLSYITSPDASNLITQNMTAYREYYSQQRRINPSLRDCTSPTPYYDKTGYKCISCPSDYPYFNLDLNKCQSCGTLHYNSNTKKCEQEVRKKHHYEIDPTIGRFIANVI